MESKPLYALGSLKITYMLISSYGAQARGKEV